MLGNKNYYNASIRKVAIAFAKLFADIKIDRYRNDGTLADTIAVPLAFGSKEHWYYRLQQDPEAGTLDQTNVMMTVPRMSYEITGLTYDSERKFQSTGRNYAIIQNSNGDLKAQYNPVPWNIGFNLNIIVKNVDDGYNILEQIIPYFTPSITVNINDIPEMGIEKDIPIIFNSISSEDNWDGRLEDRRMVIHTLSFTAKAYLYPVIQVVPIIKTAITNFLVDPNPDPVVTLTETVSPVGVLSDQDFTSTETIVDHV